MENICKCGTNIEEEIREAIKDSREDQSDGYTDCKSCFVTCPKCDTTYDIYYDENLEVVKRYEE